MTSVKFGPMASAKIGVELASAAGLSPEHAARAGSSAEAAYRADDGEVGRKAVDLLERIGKALKDWEANLDGEAAAPEYGMAVISLLTAGAKILRSLSDAEGMRMPKPVWDILTNQAWEATGES